MLRIGSVIFLKKFLLFIRTLRSFLNVNLFYSMFHFLYGLSIIFTIHN